MNALIRVTGAWTRLLTDWLDRMRLQAPQLRAAVSAYALDDVVPLTDWAALLHEAVVLKPGLPALGLDIGAAVAPHHVGVLGYLVMASDNLGQALAAYQHYERLFYGADLAELKVTPSQVEISWAPGGGSALTDEVAIAALVSFMRKQVSDPPNPARVDFVHAATKAHKAVCERFFGCQVRFGRARTAVAIPMDFLAIPMPRREPALHALLDKQAQALLDALPEPNAFDKAVQQLLVRLLPEGEVNVDKVAAALHQSTRTLQRRLADSGMSWQQLLDRTREQLAKQYLRDAALSLAEIALLLGYSEQSAFTRSFKRWTGETPLSFRTQSVHH